MRCPDCGKFVPYDTEVEPEENSVEAADGTFTAEYRRVLTCEECGTELKECVFELEHAIGCEPCKADPGSKSESAPDHDWEVEADVEPTTGAVTIDRKGKPITNPRYIKTTYGVSVHVKLTCSKCAEEVEFDCSDEAAASSFDELT